jgi:regulatory protein
MPKRPSLAYALYLLGRRGRTKRELQDKLTEKRYPADDIAATLTRLTGMGLLNDATFAENYARDKVAIYRRGRYRIGLDLLRKGVSRDDIDAALATIEEGDEQAAAESLATARLKNWNDLEPLKRRARLLSLLQRRGFSPKVVRSVIERLLQK